MTEFLFKYATFFGGFFNVWEAKILFFIFFEYFSIRIEKLHSLKAKQFFRHHRNLFLIKHSILFLTLKHFFFFEQLGYLSDGRDLENAANNICASHNFLSDRCFWAATFVI